MSIFCVLRVKLQLDFPSDVPSAKLRRCSRYSKLAAAAADFARKDGHIPDDIDGTRVGTIISTGFGASENNIQFSDSVVKGDPALCSPTVFSGTVPNSCVGQICIVNGYKGVSTVLMETYGRKMSMAFVKLKENYLLRGWLNYPYSVIDLSCYRLRLIRICTGSFMTRFRSYPVLSCALK